MTSLRAPLPACRRAYDRVLCRRQSHIRVGCRRRSRGSVERGSAGGSPSPGSRFGTARATGVAVDTFGAADDADRNARRSAPGLEVERTVVHQPEADVDVPAATAELKFRLDQ